MHRPCEPRGWTPLLYTCFSRVLRYATGNEQRRILEVAKVLLDGGADANSFFTLEGERESALFGAVGVTRCAELAEMLIWHGAEVTDPEAAYHAGECEDISCIRVLFENGLDADNRATVLLRHLDFENPDLLQEILNAGGDPNARGIWKKNALPQAILRGRSRVVIELLVDAGVDVRSQMEERETPILMALRHGRRDVAEVLIQAGASVDEVAPFPTGKEDVDALLKDLGRRV
jgi:hypothetical protein